MAIVRRLLGCTRQRWCLLSVTERNALYLEIEVFWAAFLSAVTAFNAPFALRLGATNAEIGPNKEKTYEYASYLS